MRLEVIETFKQYDWNFRNSTPIETKGAPPEMLHNVQNSLFPTKISNIFIQIVSDTNFVLCYRWQQRCWRIHYMLDSDITSVLTGLSVGVNTSNMKGSSSRQAVRRLMFCRMWGDDSFLIVFTRFLVFVSLRWLCKRTVHNTNLWITGYSL